MKYRHGTYNTMDISSAGIVDGKILDRFGAKGSEFTYGGMPSRSLPVEIYGAPAGTASFALVFDDPDSIPPCGFKWVHWLVAGFRTTKLPENASQDDPRLVQGANSWYGHGVEDRFKASFYGGPSPPDREHTYVLTVYALDFVPVLRTGFTAEDLAKVSKDHVLAKATLKGRYSPA